MEYTSTKKVSYNEFIEEIEKQIPYAKSKAIHIFSKSIDCAHYIRKNINLIDKKTKISFSTDKNMYANLVIYLSPKYKYQIQSDFDFTLGYRLIFRIYIKKEKTKIDFIIILDNPKEKKDEEVEKED